MIIKQIENFSCQNLFVGKRKIIYWFLFFTFSLILTSQQQENNGGLKSFFLLFFLSPEQRWYVIKHTCEKSSLFIHQKSSFCSFSFVSFISFCTNKNFMFKEIVGMWFLFYVLLKVLFSRGFSGVVFTDLQGILSKILLARYKLTKMNFAIQETAMWIICRGTRKG